MEELGRVSVRNTKWSNTKPRPSELFNPSFEVEDFCAQIIQNCQFKKWRCHGKNDSHNFMRRFSVSLPDLNSSRVNASCSEYWAASNIYLNERFNLPKNAIILRPKTCLSLPNIHITTQSIKDQVEHKRYLGATGQQNTNVSNKELFEQWVLIQSKNADFENDAVKMILNQFRFERYVAKEKEILLCELQKSYEKLLIKYAEAENTIDRMKLGFVDSYKPKVNGVTQTQLKAIGYKSTVYQSVEANNCNGNFRTNFEALEDDSPLIIRNALQLNSPSITSVGSIQSEVISFPTESLSAIFVQQELLPNHADYKCDNIFFNTPVPNVNGKSRLKNELRANLTNARELDPFGLANGNPVREEQTERAVKCKANISMTSIGCVTKENYLPNANHSQHNYCVNEEVFSAPARSLYLENQKSCCNEYNKNQDTKSTRSTNMFVEVPGRDIYSSKQSNRRQYLKGKSGVPKLSVYPNKKLTREDEKQTMDDNERLVDFYGEDSKSVHGLEKTEKAALNNLKLETKINFTNLQEHDNPLDNIQSERRNSSGLNTEESTCSEKCHDFNNQKSGASNFCVESLFLKEKSNLLAPNCRDGEQTSTYRYALVWPICFLSKDEEAYLGDRNPLQTHSVSSVNLSAESCDSISSLEMTASCRLREGGQAVCSVSSFSSSVLDATVSKTSIDAGARENVKDTDAESCALTQLLSSITKAENVASELKRKSEELKLFLISQLENIS